jgi:hypothetical protein
MKKTQNEFEQYLNKYPKSKAKLEKDLKQLNLTKKFKKENKKRKNKHKKRN